MVGALLGSALRSTKAYLVIIAQFVCIRIRKDNGQLTHMRCQVLKDPVEMQRRWERSLLSRRATQRTEGCCAWYCGRLINYKEVLTADFQIIFSLVHIDTFGIVQVDFVSKPRHFLFPNDHAVFAGVPGFLSDLEGQLSAARSV